MRANDDFTNKDYVLGGSYNTTYDSGAYIVDMKLNVRIQKASDYGIYKCIAKNAIGNSEETIKILRKSSATFRGVKFLNLNCSFSLFNLSSMR